MDTLTNTQTPQKSDWFKFVLFAGMLVFAFYASTHMVAAGDTWVAMACGRHFSNHGVDTVEPFSFNSHPAGPSEETLKNFPTWTHGLIKKWHPTGWINQNWLTHLIFYKLATWFGADGDYNYNALVYWKFAIYFLAVFCVYATGKLLGAGNYLSAAGACLAMIVGRTFFDIRPAGYSNLLVPVYVLILVLATYRNFRYIWLMVPLVVFWANVHGGYLYAFIMLMPFVGIHVLLQLPRRWSICLGFTALWLVMYMFSYKFISNNYYLQVQKLLGNHDFAPALMHNKLFMIWVILAIISVTLTVLKNMRSRTFYAYHIGAGVLYFLSIAPRFFTAEIPRNLTPLFKEIYSYFVSSSQMTFLFIFVFGSLLILAMALKKERFIALPTKGIYHSLAASVVGFIAMILFNPFHLTNLTHTFEISISKHAESWRQVNEWKPAFNWMDKTTSTPNPVGEEEAFGAMCILTLAVIIVWLAAHLLKPRLTQKNNRKQSSDPPTRAFEWPKVDLAIIVISLLTLYMAIRSRRFIAIVGSAAAPALALMIIQSWQMVTARIRWKREGSLRSMVFPLPVQRIAQGGIALLIVCFGVFWGMKYKRIYLDPWPTDDRYHNVFMRMTASHLKPFEVCEFINDNKINGRVFNYWTEGGAIAFGQEADSENGHIPLKLFMDGRAQAAYNHNTFRLWQLIQSGGPVVQKAKQKNRAIDNTILTEAGQWIDAQLKDKHVWVALMPESESNSTFMKALKTTKNWKTAYTDNTQHLVVDTDTPQGQALLDSILQGTALFPDAFSKNLTTATAIVESQYAKRYADLYKLANSAFQEHPYPPTIQLMVRLTNIPTFREQVIKELRAFVNDFHQNQSAYFEKDGAVLRAASAEISARYLIQLAPEEKEHYRELAEHLRTEIKKINQERIW